MIVSWTKWHLIAQITVINNFFFNSAGKNMEQSTEFSVKSPDGKALELMSLADQCQVSLSWKFSFPTSTHFFPEKL